MAVTAIFGARVKRKEDPRLITGKGSYTADVTPPGCLYIAFVRSPYAHARIKSINASKATSMKGVIAVYTGKDLKGKLNPVPTGWPIKTDPPIKIPTYYPLPVDKVRFQGEPVAAVVAEDPYLAKDAAEAIEVEYEPLPAVVNQEDAVKPGSPQLYDDIPNNTSFVWNLKGGDIDAAFKEADVIIEKRLINHRLQPTPMEPRAVVAQYNPGTGELTCYVTTQAPHIHRFLLSVILNMPEHKIRVIAVDVGGGFGSKIPTYGIDAVVCHIARELGRPVKFVEDRRENYLATAHGRDHVQYVQLAAKKDGRILGIKVTSYANLGAYLSTASPGVPTYLFGLMLSGAYKIKAVDCKVYGVLTNTAPTDAYRGAGRPEATYLLERMIDILANKLKMDPAEIRRINFIRSNEFPYVTCTGVQYDSGNYEKAFERALELAGYRKLREEQAKARAEGKLIGIGLSSYVEICGLGPSRAVRGTGFSLGLYDSAVIRVHPSGKVTVLTGTSPHGQGEETAIAQIVAEEFGIPIDDVEVVHGDTAMIQWGMGTYGSRTVPVGGGAIVLAARKILDKAKKIAANMLEVKEEDIVFEKGKFYVKGAPARAVTFQQVALASYQGEYLPVGMEPGLDATAFYDPENFTFPFGTHVCVVEVDKETGQIKILKYVSVDDCGRQINPMIVEGQVHGGITQGLAQALWEEAVYDKNGNLMTATLQDYVIPTAVEVPNFITDYTVTPSPHNPLGAKGVGETGTIAATPAIINAVVDALSHLGIDHIDMPLRTEKIWRILREKLK
ncbi:MAG: glyceraldehyde dehydrogenase subunit alpha [Thermoproteota archaeon]